MWPTSARCLPRVKGLQDVAFNDHGAKFIEVSFEEDGIVADNKTGFEQFKAFFAELLKGGSGEPKTFGEDEIKRVALEAASAASAASAPLQTKIADLEAKLTQQTVKFTEREAALAGGATKLKAEQAVIKLKSAGRWIPAFDKAGVPLVFEELAKLSVTVEFGEAPRRRPPHLSTCL